MSDETLQSLAENDALFSSMLNQIAVGIAECDLTGRLVTVNDKYCEIVGYAREELLGRRFSDLTLAEDLPENLKLFQKCAADGTPFTIEKRYVRKDGSEVWVKNSVSLLRDAAGKPQYLLAVVSDVTAEKLAQTALLQSERRYRALIDASAQTVLTMSADGSPDLHRQWFSRLTGIPVKELQGNKYLDVIHPDDRRYLQKAMSQLLQNPEPYEVEVRMRPRDSENYRFYNLRGVPVYKADGALNEWIGTVTDVTERKEAEIARRQIEQRYQALFEDAGDAIFVADVEGVFTNVNESACRLLAARREEIIGTNFVETVLPAERAKLKKLRQRLLQGSSDLGEWTLIRRDGMTIPTEINTRILPDGQWQAIVRDISTRRQSDKTKAHLAAIIESSEDAIISKDLNGVIMSWNKGAEKIFGYTAEEIIGKPITILIPPQRLDEEPKILGRIRSGEGVEHYETRRRRKDGTDIDISLTVSPIRDDSGVIIGASKIARDITERKEAEEALRESQAILSLSMRSSRMGAWVQDIKSDYVWWSQELKEIFGLEKGGFSNNRKGFYDFVHPDDRERISGEVKQAIKERRDYAIEFRFLHADGSIRWMEGRGQAFYSEKGEVIRLYGIGIDITERRQIQEQLIRAERRAAEDYQSLLSRFVPLAQTLGTARDLTSIYRSVNEFVRTSMPCTAFFVSFYEPATSFRVAAYVCGEEGEVDVSTLPPMLLTEDGGPNSQAVFQKKPVVVNRYMDLMKDRPHVILQENGVNPMSSLVVPMTVMNRIIGTLEVQAYEDDAFAHEHVVALEMVANLAAVAIENVRLLQVEEHARQEAETANRAKDEFLSVLSHELRTPLNSMFGWTRMLRAGVLDEDKTRQAIEVIERNVRLQNSLIEDMLDVSRIITGKMRIEKAETNFAAVVNSAVEAARPLAEQKKVSLVFNSDDCPYVMLGDEVRLQQIVSNLINNAIKFTPEDGAVILDLSAGAAGDSVLLNVTDTGIGIEPDFLPQIFDRFRQADSTTRRMHSGLGLGLTIVRHLTELHGGRVSAESEGIGKGASFTIELPLLPKPEANPNHALPTGNGHGHTLKGARILLVDDDCDAMMPLQIILEAQEAEVLCASSVYEALRHLAEGDFSLLVSDIGMPEMDGYDLITALRKMDASRNHDIPAIALTAYASTQDRRRALMSGFQHHFSKPLDFEQFLATVASLLAYSKNK
ncbi:MAG: PAS domain S-box protein [Acidobacteriota bacterium]|nr:PAS domain S-box protein [Acidobacteriota bacterium]